MVVNSLQHIKNIMPEIETKLAYQETADYAEWSETSREKLRELLGLPLTSCDNQFTIIDEKDFESYRQISFEFQSEPGHFVPCTMLVPKEMKAPVPGVICMQGHSTGSHISLGEARFPGDEPLIAGGRDFARLAVQEGYCAIAMEQRYMGVLGQKEDGYPACMRENEVMAGLLIGRTAIGERVWDVQRLIDVIEKHLTQYIDIERLMCMGNSGGGTTTFYASCLDERIKLSIPSCSVCTYESSIVAMRHCTCNYVPHIRNYFNMGDLGCLITPRSLIVVCGIHDPIFPLEGVEESYAVIEKAYKAFGKEDKCCLVKGDGGHQFYPELVWPIVKEWIGAC